MKKVIRWVDFLRPKMNLRHRGALFEYTIFSGIVSLVSIVLIVASVIYFARPLIWRQKPTTNIYEAFSKDNYTFPINSSFYTHFITFSDLNFQTTNELDFTYLRIIGGRFGLNAYEFLNERESEVEEYWIYGKCDQSDFVNISDPYVLALYNDSACIKKYYNVEENKYYDKNDINFRWPVLLSQDNSSIGLEKNQFNILIEKCHQKTLDLLLGQGYRCKNDSEIYDYIEKGRRVFFSFLNYDVDLYNYKNPNSSYWITMENRLYNDYMTVIKTTNSPLMIKTNKGVIFDHTEKKFIMN